MAGPLTRSRGRLDEGLIRVGDVERERALTALREHYALGRIDAGELDERLAAALVARTRDDLARLFADLPGERPPSPAAARTSYDPWQLARWLLRTAPVVTALIVGLVVLALVWAVAVGGFLLWIVFFCWLLARGSGRPCGRRRGQTYHALR